MLQNVIHNSPCNFREIYREYYENRNIKKKEIVVNERKETRLLGIGIRFNPYRLHRRIMADMDTYKVFKAQQLKLILIEKGLIILKFDKKMLSEKLGQLTDATGKIAANITDKTKDIVVKSKDTVMTAIDVNGDGKVDIEDIIILGLKTPGISVNRSDFLSKELMKNHSKEIINQAIATTPANAGIPPEEINLIADNVIKFERTCVTGISTALGAPGGTAMVATIPADIIQYYGYMLRAAQKIMYLYGFPEIDTSVEGEKFDSETLNILIVCIGVMYGVAGANNAIKAMAKALACGVEKKLINTALTKGTIFPIVKSISKWFGVRMTKEVFAGFFKKAIPVVGGVIGGGITYVSFKPCCDKLKSALQDTLLSNPNHQEAAEENIIIEAGNCDITENE